MPPTRGSVFRLYTKEIMKEYHFSNVTDNTLNDFLDLNMPAGMLEHTQNSLNQGTLSYAQMYLFQQAERILAAFTLGNAPIVVPRADFSLSHEDLHAFATMLPDVLKEHQAEDKILILDSNLTAIDADVFEEAGWQLQGHDKLYQTDVSAGEWQLEPSVSQQPAAALLSEAMQEFYDALLQEDATIGDTDSNDPKDAFAEAISDESMQLFVMEEHGNIIAAATLSEMMPEHVAIHLLGVLPSRRGQGIGARLHAHLLAVAKAQGALRHVGGTAADNHAMHAIYQQNGAELTAEHYQFRL